MKRNIARIWYYLQICLGLFSAVYLTRFENMWAWLGAIVLLAAVVVFAWAFSELR